MSIAINSKPTIQVAVLTLVALGLLAVIFYASVWWVSLTAPNYPKESFPDGVRIEFLMNGVFNGCKKQKREEITEAVALDCVHEMDTINHYVGMYPIAAGGPIERALGQFLVTFLGVMLLGFMCTRPGIRMGILAIGFTGLAVWMGFALYGPNGVALENVGYIKSMVSSLDQEAASGTGEQEFVIGGIVGALKNSLEESGVKVELPSEKAAKARKLGAGAKKEEMIDLLRTNYEVDQSKSGEMPPWNGSLYQLMTWHYGKSLGRYFNNPKEIVPMVAHLKIAINVVFFGLLGAMLLLIYGARKNGGILYWLLVLVPMALPALFVIDYAAWLWWYGHTLNAMGAFSVKPFMPTVFGDGKVAQFATHSYPDKGFGLMILTSLLLAVAALIRFKQFKKG